MFAFGVVVTGVISAFGKKLYDYLNVKNENGESNWDMVLAFGDRAQEYIDDNRDYFKIIINFLQIVTQHLNGAINVDWPRSYSNFMDNL